MTSSLHDEKDWQWEENENDWDRTVDREEKNKEKKEKEKAKNIEKVKKVMLVGQSSIVIGPIKDKLLDYFHKITGDFEEANKMAAVEFLTAYHKFDSRDMSDVNITDTRMSGKGDEIVYIVLDDPDKVKEIRRRLADSKNPWIKTRDFIPPQVYKRYAAMSKFAAEYRGKNKDMKTQIRFGNDDIHLLTKVRGSEDPFEIMDMEEIEIN